MSANNVEVWESSGSSLHAALARTATRSIALYFSRPVRLFRPSKVSGWHSLRGLAVQHGTNLSPQYITSLVKSQGLMVIPKHFIPPMLVNAALGTVLWATYGETSSYLDAHIGSHPTILAASSGAIAGGMQALLAAPAENVRLVLEGGSGHSWSHAWKEVFRGTASLSHPTKQQTMEEIRQVRGWMKEVTNMAGRGWDGWGWGCAKDICGFAAFFAIFDITRRVAFKTRAASQSLVESTTSERDRGDSVRRYFPRTVHGITLVTGGVIAGLAYEVISRPWDVARKTVELDKLTHPTSYSRTAAIIRKISDDGVSPFFRNPAATSGHAVTSRGLYGALRTFARVGPWGVGFLVWETYGLGLV